MQQHFKVRGEEEDLEIVTLLLANLALALDTDQTLDLGSLVQQFGFSLRKLQVAPSGGTNVMANLDLDSWLESNRRKRNNFL